jgi:pimeloyl-ACP methyl ester carboxylesterase
LLTDRDVRRDTRRLLRSVFTDRDVLLAAAERLREFQGPALVVWGTEDRVMPLDHGRRLAQLLPHGALVEIEDSRTLVPLDQPDLLAGAIREFVASATARTPPSRREV